MLKYDCNKCFIVFFASIYFDLTQFNQFNLFLFKAIEQHSMIILLSNKGEKSKDTIFTSLLIPKFIGTHTHRSNSLNMIIFRYCRGPGDGQ